MNTLSAIEIENMEHAFGGKLFQRIRDNRAAKRDTRQTNKLQRINARQAGGGVLGKIGSAVGSIFGKTTTYSDDPALMQDRGLQLSFDDQAAIDAQKQKQTTNMIIIAVVIIVIAILVIVMLKKKKKATA